MTFVVHQAPTYPLEAIAEIFDGAARAQLWSQLYLPADRDVAAAVLGRIKLAGCPVLCVTVDNPVPPRTRQRDFTNRVTTPARPYPDRQALIRMGPRHRLWAANTPAAAELAVVSSPPSVRGTSCACQARDIR